MEGDHRKLISRINFLVSYECNLRCKYCYIAHKRLKVGTQDFSHLIKDAWHIANLYDKDNIKVQTVRFIGAEPLTVPPDILVQCINVFKAVLDEKGSVLITTNGTLLDDYYVAVLKANLQVPLRFIVSIDGSEEINDKYRGRGTFKKAIEGAQRVRDAGWFVAIQGVLSEEILSDMSVFEDYQKFIKSLGLPISFLLPHSGHTLSPETQYRFAKYLVYRGMSNDYVQHRRNSIDCFKRQDYNDLRFDIDGSVSPCETYVNLIKTTYRVDSLDKIYKTFPLLEVKHEATADECQKCFMQKYCLKTCPLEKPRIDINCDFRRTLFEEEARLRGITPEEMVDQYDKEPYFD